MVQRTSNDAARRRRLRFFLANKERQIEIEKIKKEKEAKKNLDNKEFN